MRNKKVLVLSHTDFDELMMNRGVNDSNVEALDDEAFISIIGTKECLKYYLDEEETKHYFSDGHPNVLNLDFDDIGRDITWHGHEFKAFTEEQADMVIDFIEANIDKSFTIHCRAGLSRSQAVAHAIKELYNDYYNEDNTDFSSLLRDHANKDVLAKIKRQFYKKYDFLQS